MSRTPLSITVVVPVRNEARFIRSTLEQLLGQDYPADRFEIIVADGQSDDGTPAIVRDIAAMHPNVRLMENTARRSSAGRNLGFRHGRGDVFLVIDGHCHIPSRDLLAQVARCFQESGADCLGRPQHLDPPGISSFQSAVALARASWLGHGGGSLIYGNAAGFASPVSNGAAYTRAVFERVGYVDETFDACEDVEFNWRVEQAGPRCFTSPRLMVRYYPRESLGGLWRQVVRYGQGRYRLYKKHPATLSLSTLAPPAFVLGMAACVLAGLLAGVAGHSPVAWTACAQPLVYSTVVLAEALRIGTGQGFAVLRHLPVIFPAIHAGLGAGFLSASMESGKQGAAQ